MTITVKDVLLRTVVVLLLLARQSGANDENKAWLSRLLRSLEDQEQKDPPGNSYRREPSHKLQDFISPNSQLSRDPPLRARTELQRQSIVPNSQTRENQLVTRRSNLRVFICCNVPPTTPPTTKRGNYDENKAWLSRLLRSLKDQEQKDPPENSYRREPSHKLQDFISPDSQLSRDPPPMADENKSWLSRLLTPLEDQEQKDPPENSYRRERSHKLEDFISPDSQLSRDPPPLAELQRQTSVPSSLASENQLEMKRSFGGLLCCNSPPTTPPKSKRGNYDVDDHFRQWLLTQKFGPAYITASLPGRQEHGLSRNHALWQTEESGINSHSSWRKRGVKNIRLKKSFSWEHL